MGGTNLAKSLRHSLMPDNAYRPCSIINSDQSVPLLHCKRLLRGYPQPHLLYLHNTINTLHEIYPSEQSTDSTRPQSKKKMYAVSEGFALQLKNRQEKKCVIKVRNDFNKPRRRSNRGRHVAPPTCARLHPWRRSSSTTTRRSTLPSTSHSSLVYSLQQRFNAGIALYCLISHSLSWHPRTETCRNFFNAAFYAFQCTTIYAFQYTNIYDFQCTIIYAIQYTTIYAFQYTTIYAFQSITFYAFQCTTFYAFQFTTVYTFQCTILHVFQYTTVHAFQYTTVYAFQDTVKDKNMIKINKQEEHVVLEDLHLNCIILKVVTIVKSRSAGQQTKALESNLLIVGSPSSQHHNYKEATNKD
uniref:Uncharacterized protein n=1 Tax=Physcomitrium patens TaxID=3218 RepID=A0A2K1JJ18_PHYPA|nr:hypothetical protein PHYPA_018950 [Physcomitrium patens]